MEFEINSFIEASKLSSMDHWYPLIEFLRIPQPKTQVVLKKSTCEWMSALEGIPLPEQDIIHILNMADKMGYPLFMRTDQASAKHAYKNSCMVHSRETLLTNLLWLVEENVLHDLNFTTLYFREFIELDSKFAAFEGLPIAPERRYFIKDDNVICHHPYWVESAIKFYHTTQKYKDTDWKKKLAEMNTETPQEVMHLTALSHKVAEVLPGSWSVDFAQGKDGIWYLIDMADARLSWHPESCEYFRELTIEEPDSLKTAASARTIEIDHTAPE